VQHYFKEGFVIGDMLLYLCICKATSIWRLWYGKRCQFVYSLQSTLY